MVMDIESFQSNPTHLDLISVYYEYDYLDLEIFLDYIIQIKSDSQVNALKLLESDEPIELSILNIYTLETRKIYISEPRSSIKLGLYIRYESINPLILHITKVLNSSPAE